jgi:hypothetical protein
MLLLLRTLALAVLVASCTSDSAQESDCESGERLTHACASASGLVCESASCVKGRWACPEDLFYTDGCPIRRPDRDCSDLGGGQAVLAERCLGDVVEYCIYSDTTQTATWTEIESCPSPLSCQELQDEACCQSEGDTCLN